MALLTTTFEIPQHIVNGLISGEYERVGGVIRLVQGKQIVAWLRDLATVQPQLLLDGSSVLPPSFDPLTGALRLAVSVANTGISMKGFADVNQRLGGIEHQLTDIGQNLHQVKGILQVTSAASILNLGVSVMGFAILTQRLRDLEQQLQQAQDLLSRVNRKVDLGFYANFRAALDLAGFAFRMTQASNRESMAIQAINRFLEAEHIYADYVDQELEQGSQISDEYLLTLALAYIAEARCHLELEEWETAVHRFHEGAQAIRSRIYKYINLLLTSNPSAYLDPQFKGQIDLRRLTRVYQWLDPSLDENAVFELQRENLFNWKEEKGIRSSYKWVNSLPTAIVDGTEVQGTIFGNREETKDEAMQRLPKVMEVMESMIETYSRFEAYQLEIKAIAHLGISFHDWMQLDPSDEPSVEGVNVMYVIPSEPITIDG